MNKVIDKGFRSCRFVSTIVKHPVKACEIKNSKRFKLPTVETHLRSVLQTVPLCEVRCVTKRALFQLQSAYSPTDVHVACELCFNPLKVRSSVRSKNALSITFLPFQGIFFFHFFAYSVSSPRT